ncbi:MAG: protein kinase [Planctomycetes bacterium]|nr:protein kinase [Planctomycetota bacterium]
MRKVFVTCPRCGKIYEVEESVLGQQTRCTNEGCGSTFVLAATNATAAATPEKGGVHRMPESSPSPAVDEPNVPLVWKKGDVILELYEVKDVFTGGGMGLVYRVHHRQWNVDLAVKCPRAQYFQTEHQKENFEREAETWVNLNLHPHTVFCHYVRRLGGIPRVFAEFVEGGSLADWIHGQEGRTRGLYEGGPQKALERILDLAIQIAWGLHFAHENGLIHQDVKPANVLMTADGTAKVTDFGLARARAVAEEAVAGKAGQSILVSTGGMTPAYCSPEQWHREKLTRKTDIWSWAVSVLEMFTGEVTWPNGSVAPEALEGYLEMGTGTDNLPNMPAALVQLLRRCLQNRPEERPKDMLEIAAALHGIYQQNTFAAYPREAPKWVDLLADSLNNRAVSVLDLRKTDKADQLTKRAEELWQRALQADPHHPESTYNLGLLQWRAAKLDDVQLLRQLTEVHATHTGSWLAGLLLAQVHLERGDCDAALANLGRVPDTAAGSTEVAALTALAAARQPASRRLVRTFEGHRGSVVEVALTTDGRTAISLGATDDDGWIFQDNTVRCWEVGTGHSLGFLDGGALGTLFLCLSPEGRYALSTNQDDPGRAVYTYRVWETATGRCRGALMLDKLYKKYYRFALTPQGEHILVAKPSWESGGVEVWEVATGRCLHTLTQKDMGAAVWVNARGQLLIPGNPSRGWELTLWEPALGSCLRTLEVDGNLMNVDGGYAFTGDGPGFTMWEVATGRRLQAFKGYTEEVRWVCASADGKLVLSRGEKTQEKWDLDGLIHFRGETTLRLWETDTGRCLSTFSSPGKNVTALCLSPDGRFGLFGTEDGQVSLWSLEGGWNAPWAISRVQATEKARDTETAYQRSIQEARDAAARGDIVGAATVLQKARSLPGCERRPEVLQAWAALYTRLPRKSLRGGWEGKTSPEPPWIRPPTAACLSPDGQQAVVGCAGGNLHLWEVRTAKCLSTLQGHQYQDVRSVCLTPDLRQVVSSGGPSGKGIWDGDDEEYSAEVRVLDLATGHCRLRLGGYYQAPAIALSPDGRYLLLGDYKFVQLWDLLSGQCLRRLEVPKRSRSRVYSIAWSPDGRHAVSSSKDQTLRLWDVASGRCLHTFTGHTSIVHSVTLSLDGRYALSGSADQCLRLWEMASGRCLQTYQLPIGLKTGVCLSGDARYALSGGTDSTARLWDLATGQCLRTFQGHRSALSAVCLSADGSYALSLSEDRTAKLWVLDWELENKQPADWDEGARPYLEHFLSTHTSYAACLVLTRQGKPSWTVEDFQRLLYTLGCAGYGWLKPEGVHRELEKMAASWQGPPPL